MCDHVHCIESKNFDEAKATHQKLIQLLEAIIQKSKDRIAEIDRIDRTIFPDLKAYDTYQAAEKVRTETRTKITKQVDELVDKIRPIWSNYVNPHNYMLFNGFEVQPGDLDRLARDMHEHALRNNSTALAKKFVDEFCKLYR